MFKDFRIFKNICTWASQYCPTSEKANNRYPMGVTRNQEIPKQVKTGEEILSQK